jgi:hypothetical protein
MKKMRREQFGIVVEKKWRKNDGKWPKLTVFKKKVIFF